MALLPYIVAYIGIAVFAIAVVARIFMWSRMPLHLRWELYPVAHEGKKAHYGGSYLEEPKWWTQKREVSLWGEIKGMVPEMLFLVALKEHNPKLWRSSFPFHFGLYLTAGCTALMILAGLVGTAVPAAMAGGLGILCKWAIVVGGVSGLCLGLVGAVGLLWRRLGTPELRHYASPADIFNLVIFIVAFFCALLTFALVDRDFAIVSGFVANLVTFSPTAFAGEGLNVVLPVATVICLALVVAYIPLTHMSHFVGKYFAYHAIRWNDAPNLRGGKEEPMINALLQHKISWSAPHINNGDGKRTWAEAATEIPSEEHAK